MWFCLITPNALIIAWNNMQYQAMWPALRGMSGFQTFFIIFQICCLWMMLQVLYWALGGDTGYNTLLKLSGSLTLIYPIKLERHMGLLEHKVVKLQLWNYTSITCRKIVLAFLTRPVFIKNYCSNVVPTARMYDLPLLKDGCMWNSRLTRWSFPITLVPK